MSTTSTKTPDAYQEYKKHPTGRTGTAAAWQMKLTSLALIPLGVWFVVSVLGLSQDTYTDASLWIQKPVSGVLVLLFTVVSLYHAMIGVKVIIEDYVHCKKARFLSLLASKLLHYILIAIAVVSVVKILL